MIVDLTHPITNDLPVYFPWHPPVHLEQTANYRDHRCLVTKLSIGTHSGTHIDAPSHVLEGMPTIDRYDVSLWFVDAWVMDFTPREPGKVITAEEVRSKFKTRGMGAIVKTGWDKYFGREDFYKTYPPLSVEAAEFLAGMDVPVIASDSPYTLDVHYIFLRKGIPLITNINNTAILKPGKVKLIAAPLLIQGGDGAPARVLAIMD